MSIKNNFSICSMKSINTLPDEYEELYSVDMQKDKKMALIINLLAIIIAILLILPMHFIVPIYTLFDMENGLVNYFIRFLVLMVLMIVYLVLHELVHGIAMKMCGTKKVEYGFTGMYAYAKSSDYYNKRSYIFIALAPVILLGTVLAVINPFVSIEWFWVVYLIQISNISGAAGDFFVTFKFSTFPKDILVRDYGVSMTVYSKKI